MKIVQKLVSLGVDISTKKALKAALKAIGAQEENIDKMYVELKNSMNRKSFLEVKANEKIIILPQCLRNSKECKAKLTKDGYACVKCGACKICEIKERAEKMGHGVFIVPGGSMAINIIKTHKPKAVLGVACLNELITAIENVNTPTQGVQLLRKGCIDTDVNIDEIFSLLGDNEGGQGGQFNRGV